ncbi:MAG: haloacid dehalogenase type II [Acidobacteriales bacterium]|nr:haloacid dehalogenase type II [Candidatus Koribacter versatilis]MBI3644642.1 haloacid dehalogenase type II [Terriglobales bacterium]
MNFSAFTTISFDCYGTLIDWESGLLPAIRGLLTAHGPGLPDAAILELYGEFEAQAEAGPYQSYRNVLESVVRQFGERCGFRPSPAELRSLHESVPSWPPFTDTVAALQKLQKRYRVAVISNIDDDLFAETRKRLGVEFAGVITAQQARSYKPSANNFQLALRTLGISPERLLHAAQSVYHDVIPAQALGVSTVWVNRRSARPGVGAVRAATARPDLEVADVAALAALAVRD